MILVSEPSEAHTRVEPYHSKEQKNSPSHYPQLVFAPKELPLCEAIYQKQQSANQSHHSPNETIGNELKQKLIHQLGLAAHFPVGKNIDAHIQIYRYQSHHRH